MTYHIHFNTALRYQIPDLGIRKMILHMIQLEPEARLSAESYLQNYAAVVFPTYFSPFLHHLYCCWNPLHPDMRVAMCQKIFPEVLQQMMSSWTNDDEATYGLEKPGNNISDKFQSQMTGKQTFDIVRDLRCTESKDKSLFLDRDNLLNNSNNVGGNAKANYDCSGSKSVPDGGPFPAVTQDLKQCDVQAPGQLLETISNAFKRNDHPFLKNITTDDLNSLMSEYDCQSDTFGMPIFPLLEDNIKCEGMVLIASLLCSCIRNVKLPHLRRAAILLLKSSALHIDDEDRLQRVLPYVIAMLSDPAAIVRCAALETLCDILPLVRDFPPSDAKIFPEYILPMLSMLPDDPEESVRICYASNIAKLALTAYGFLIHSLSLSEAGVLDELSPQKLLESSTETSGQMQRMKNDKQLLQLRKSVAEVVQELVMGPKQTPNIRRALLLGVGNLCCFFGQRQSNDFLLPILPAFLNDRDEQLRELFYGKIVYVCFFVGQRSVEEYLLPYIEQALSDQTEAVIVNALDCLTILCRRGFLRKQVLLEMIERAFPLLCYPSEWVRRLVVAFVAACSQSLGAVDSFVFLAPVIHHFLRRQPASLASEKCIHSCLKPTVSKQIFYEFLENARGSDMLERQRKIWYNSSTQKLWDSAVLTKTEDGELDVMKSWLGEKTNPGGRRQAVDLLKLSEDGNAKVTDLDLSTNLPSMAEIRDPQYPEKLQFSGYLSPQFGGVSSLIHDKTSEGIPLYSFSMDKRAAKIPAANSDSSLRLNTFGVASSYMPWMDPVNRSFSLTSSVPAPKLIPGSFSITGGSTQFYRVVHEPDGRENDQNSYVNAKFQEMGLSSTTKGTSLSAEDTSADLTGVTSFSRMTSIPDSGWRPRGVLVAHLQEHRSAVNEIAISNDHSFFVSASDDSTVKVWDSRKLEKDISFRSRLTYHVEGSRALCTVMLRNSPQVVVGACDGIMHLFSVDHISRGLGNVVEKYSGIADVKKKDIKEGAILSILNYTTDDSLSQIVMFSTQNCGIHLWDTRENSNAWSLKAVPEEGYVSSLGVSPCGNWFVSGSSRGVLTLWDLRFLVPVNSWHYCAVCPIEKICLFIPPPTAAIASTARPLVYVAAGCNEVSLWNAENGSCHQV